MTGRTGLTIIDAVRDSKLFAPWFRDLNTWAAWFAFLAALFALPMTEQELSIYRERTGRTEPPTTRRRLGSYNSTIRVSAQVPTALAPQPWAE